MKILITNNLTILEIHTAKGSKLISLQKILFIEAFNKGSIIYLIDKEKVTTKYLLNSYSEYLPSPLFSRCHNKFLVNCQFVDCFSYYQVILKDNQRIPLSRHWKQSFKESLIEFQQLS